MILVVNTGPVHNGKVSDTRVYEVRVNSEVITTFKHNRSQGLANCLMRAAEAVALKQFVHNDMLKPVDKRKTRKKG